MFSQELQSRTDKDQIETENNEKPDKNKIHVGIENVKSRLSLLCDGSLEISSKQGVGTRCKISIPKKQNSGIKE